MSRWHRIGEWVKEHKKGIAIACIGAAGAGICYRYRDEIFGVLKGSVVNDELGLSTTSAIASIIPTENVKDAMTNSVVDSAARNANYGFGVAKHVRNLPAGWTPSPEKVATALENGFVLENGQTWVEDYVKGAMAA